ncbi:hypothetical protein MMC08_006885 [Hypocenomyce scalaris]|nr:hypothetical protein [Hypocenomyce scalaris]
MTSSNDLPLLTRFVQSIAADAREKEAEMRRQRLEEEQRRNDEVRATLERPPVRLDVTSEQAENFYRPEAAELEARAIPSTPPQPRRRTRPEPLPTPELSPLSPSSSSSGRHESSRQRSRIDSDNAVIRKLEADLAHERRCRQTLEDKLQRTQQQVEELRAERDATQQRLLEDARSDAARLGARVTELCRLLTGAWEEQRRLEREIGEGRERERELEGRLEGARREGRRVEKERETERERMEMERTERESMEAERMERERMERERNTEQRPQRQTTVRRGTGRQNDQIYLRKTTVTREISVPKRRNTGMWPACIIL